MKITYLFSRGTKILFSFGPVALYNRFLNYRKIKARSLVRDEQFKNKLETENIDVAQTPVVTKEINGNLMELDLKEGGISKDLFLDGLREPIATQTIKEIVTKDDIVLEIGANIGYYALLEAKMCKKVYALEPVSTNVDRLKHNIELNKLDNIEVYQMALGEVTEELDIYLSTKSNWHSFTKSTQNDNGTEKVWVLNGDFFLIDKERPTILRMDVEGYETKILKGLSKTLKNGHVKFMFIEIHPHLMPKQEVKDFFDIIFGNGYETMKIVKEDKVGIGQVVDTSIVDKIINGCEGSYEMFFRRKT